MPSTANSDISDSAGVSLAPFFSALRHYRRHSPCSTVHTPRAASIRVTRFDAPDRAIYNSGSMNVTVFYDYNCPFCYIASRRLTLLSGEFDLSIEWKGIEIHPEFPPEGAKRGRSVKSLVLREMMGEAAGEEGIEIRSPGFAANSRLALEASEFAKTDGRFATFHYAVYEAYFGEGLNIGKPDVLLSIGERAGIDPKGLADSLESRSMRGAVESNEREATMYTVLGVPTFILGSFPVHGCQPLETMRAMIERAISRL